MAVLKLDKSAIKPIPIAPKTNPRSLQNLYTPKEVALQRGLAISLIAASKVGYTNAVPTPKSVVPVNSPKKPFPENSITQIPAA
jgi:hypothetical protein